MTELSELATSGYFYYYPLVENLKQVERYVITGVGSNPAAPFNAFSHARKLAGPEDTFVTINNDTVYSMAQLDLSVGPLRLEVPDTGDRYYVLQFVDAWTNNIAYVGTRATGNRAGRFVIVPPGWTGELPEGHQVIQASTRVLSIVGRFACTGPDDIPAVNAVQDAVVLAPVEPGDAVPAGMPSASAGVPASLRFWEEARLWSQAFPAPIEDSPYSEKFAPLGTSAAESPYVDASDAVSEALRLGLKGGADKLEYVTHHGKSPVINGWTVGLHLFDYNLYVLGLGTVDEDRWKITDQQHRIIERAVACRVGLWGNHAYEAVYAQAFTDGAGGALVGGNTYTMTFPERPPVGAFWSITLYDIPQYYLVANSIDRYSIGDRTAGIHYAADGSLQLTISRAEPTDSAARANWLPAPADKFRLVFRLYVPGDAILDGTYDFPAIVPAG
ncbi:DUF1254 domain-containing protein [Rhodococcus spelaei]|uniref:DUF1254 domain-containing protein n=1 Tax=Rhodococcus spelaei TaxID=2546320 RepID=A0A541B7Z4_9NOCA|nr:DUF1254 domain-containing protein [Rhodococcus spelaei]TQF68447.1 DUF1254 domain-containing protein [Rhodococcus spelaei]